MNLFNKTDTPTNFAAPLKLEHSRNPSRTTAEMSASGSSTPLPRWAPSELIAKNGDMTLVVGEGSEQCSFSVYSHCLRQASPVWQAMLSFGSFLRSQEKKLNFPEDNPEVIRVVLDIAHLNFNRFLEKPTLGFICRLMNVADKYMLTEMLRLPTAQWWQGELTNGTTDDHLWVRLNICWIMGGNERSFASDLKEAFLKATLDERGCWICETKETRLLDAIITGRDYIRTAARN